MGGTCCLLLRKGGIDPGTGHLPDPRQSDDRCWSDERDRLLIQSADSLHDRSQIDDGLWSRLAGEFTEDQLLDLLLLCGWYHAISFAANGAGVALETGAPRFGEVVAPA